MAETTRRTDGPLAGSWAERMLLARGPKAGVTLLQKEIRERYDMDLDQFYDRVFANTSPEVRQFMEDNLAKLPPHQQLESLGGLMALVGYGAGDNTATISRYDLREGQTDPNSNFTRPRTWGYYPIEGTGGNLEKFEGLPLGMEELEWLEGASPPQPGAGVAIFAPTQNDSRGDAQAFRDNEYRQPATHSRTKYGDPEGEFLGGTPNTLWHELTHRGYANPIKEDFENSSRDALKDSSYVPNQKALRQKEKRFETMQRSEEHRVIDAINIPEQQRQELKDYMQYASELNDFITPEREQQYGITKYRDPEAMTALEEIIYGLYRD
tara:strand:- start:67 stop:1038 length:972 start_codon:yes stop_codon:yes gene_type:complete